ncbi:unnamed protein product [Brassica napus]|uniref:(rape) hypothetical protein n=1 Tax=Brassica napus TaxID=3708 RepID=A0A816ICV9_BRANA|nr:unnamed protein product [Brassica napus]
MFPRNDVSSEFRRYIPRKFRGNTKFGFLGNSSGYSEDFIFRRNVRQNMVVFLYNLEEANVDGVSVDSLNSPEEQLETALSVTRATKTKLMMEFLKTRREKVSVLVCIRHPGHSAMLISRTS